MKRPFSLDNYLPRTGGWYILIVIAVAQLTAIPGAILGTISIYFNADFTPQTLTETSRLTPFFILVGNLILLVIAWYLTPNARKRLDDWSNKQLKADPREEEDAWSEITALKWRYIIAYLFVAYDFAIVPTYIYSIQNSITYPYQLFYALITR